MSLRLRLNLPSHPRFLSLVRAAIGELGVIYGWPNNECIEITLAVDEALSNIIRHAYRNRHDQEIEFECFVKGDQIEFTFLDRGEPPDPARIYQPMDQLALSGRGTHLIKAIMDEVSYTSVPTGNQLKLLKHLPGIKAGEDGE